MKIDRSELIPATEVRARLGLRGNPHQSLADFLRSHTLPVAALLPRGKGFTAYTTVVAFEKLMKKRDTQRAVEVAQDRNEAQTTASESLVDDEDGQYWVALERRVINIEKMLQKLLRSGKGADPMRDIRQMQTELLAYHIRVQNDALRMQVLRDKAAELLANNDAASAEIARLTTEIDSWSWSRDYTLQKTLAVEIENRRLMRNQSGWGCIRRFFRFITFR